MAVPGVPPAVTGHLVRRAIGRTISEGTRCGQAWAYYPHVSDPHPCANPACGRAAEVGLLCRACYRFKRRTGVVRPEHVIVATGYRQLVRELEQRAWGA